MNAGAPLLADVARSGLFDCQVPNYSARRSCVALVHPSRRSESAWHPPINRRFEVRPLPTIGSGNRMIENALTT